MSAFLVVAGDVRTPPPRIAAHSDEAAILTAFEEHGDRCVDVLESDFSFAIWDAERERLFCARDCMGVRPLYYAHFGETLIVSSSMGAILSHPLVSDDLDEGAAAAWLIGENFTFPVDTFYRHIKRLPPAHTLVFERGRLIIQRYWSLPLGGAIRYSDRRDYVDHFLELFERAVSIRLRGASAAAMMSGGLDSTSVAVTAQRLLQARHPGAPFHAYTTSFSAIVPDEEARYAGVVTRANGMTHHIMSRDSYALFDDRSTYTRSEPYEDPLAAVFIDCARGGAEHARVMFAGQGGDVVFFTSHRHFPDLLRRLRFITFAREVAAFIRRTGRLPPWNLRAPILAYFGIRGWRARFPDWLRKEVVDRFALRERFEHVPDARDLHPIRPEAHRALINPLWQRIFETWDSAETDAEIDFAYPYFDKHLLEYVFALPPLPWFANKYLLREAMRGRLPEEIRTRPKTTMAVDPLAGLMRESIGQLELVLMSAPELDTFIDRDKLLQYLRQPKGDGYSDFLAILPFCFGMWLMNRHPAKSGTRPVGVGAEVVRS